MKPIKYKVQYSIKDWFGTIGEENLTTEDLVKTLGDIQKIILAGMTVFGLVVSVA